MDVTHQLTSIFCQMDDFCKEFDYLAKHQLLSGPPCSRRGPKSRFHLCELMTILIMFHQIRYRDFKTFYTGYVLKYWQGYFPHLPSYTHFISLMRRAIFPMTLFTQLNTGKRTGIYYIDSSCLPVCHIKRSKRHKVFRDIAEYGKTSVGWFFGLKWHLVINHHGQLVAFKLTRGNRSDSQEAIPLLHTLQGLAFGDKGYIGKKIVDELLEQGLKLITRKRKNMKPQALSQYEQQLLNQRGTIETVIGHLKFHLHIWHTRHRSMLNAMTHLIAALAAYTIEPLSISAIKALALMT